MQPLTVSLPHTFANHLLVSVRNARVRLERQLGGGSRGKVLLGVLGASDPSDCIGTRRMGSMGAPYAEKI